MDKGYLWNKLSSDIKECMSNDLIYEIMLNPDGHLWANQKDQGNIHLGQVNKTEIESFVHALAQHEKDYLNEQKPFLDATLPFHNERINITIPPISQQVSFNIRKPAKVVYTLDDYVAVAIMTDKQATILKTCIRERKNILVSGSPASGKTTLANALLAALADIAPDGHRVLILEQIPELQCTVKNLKVMLTSDCVTMTQLLWIAMRNSPDRIVVGEVRDGAALDMLKAWNTGCPGGIATVHANHPQAAIQRVLDLSCEVITTPPYSLAAEALDVIVQIEQGAQYPQRRCVTGIIEVSAYDASNTKFVTHQLD